MAVSGREVIRGSVVVDAPRAQRAAGVALALVGIVALPSAMIFHGGSLGSRLIDTNALGFSIAGVLFFAGLAISAAAGRSLEGRTGRQDAILIEDDGNLTVATPDEVWTFSLRSLTGGHYAASQAQLLLFFGDDARIAVRVDDEAAARRALCQLGMDGASTTLRLSPQERVPRAVEGCLSGVAGLLTAMLSTGIAAIAVSSSFGVPSHRGLLPVLVACVIPLLLTIRWVSRFGAPLGVVLGSDGLLFVTRRQVYVPYVDVTHVEQCDDAVVIRRRSGDDLCIRTAEPDTLASALFAKLAQDVPASERLDALGRGALSIDQWRAQLEHLADDTPRYRVGYIDGERLAGIAEDPLAPLDERVAAAFVIAARHEYRLLLRVQAAAEASARPAVKSALTQAAEGELEEQALQDEATLATAHERPAA